MHATCSGRDLGVLIGKHGQTIDAIQYLVNAILAHAAGVGAKPWSSTQPATARGAGLARGARAAQRRAGARGEGDVALEPMTAVERKIVHLRLHDEAGVETASVGTEPNRYVVIRSLSPTRASA